MSPYTILSACAAALSAASAIFIAVRERYSLSCIALLLGLLALGCESVFSALSFHALSVDAVILWQKCRLLSMGIVPALFLLFSLSFARGDVRAAIDPWRAVLTLALVLPVSITVVFWNTLFTAIRLDVDTARALIAHHVSANLIHALFILVAVLAIMNLERTFRAATGTMRWRIKFMIVGVVILLAIKIYISTQALLYSSLDLSLDALNAGGLLMCETLILLSLLRSNLQSVDLYPAEHVLYRSITVMLTGVYLLAVGIMAHLATRFGLTQGFPLKAFILFVGLIGFSVLAVSDRVRQTVRRTLSRQFGRPMYNCRKVWTDFTNQTTACTSVGQLSQAVARMVSDTFAILSVTVWLVDDAKQTLTFGASTSLAEEEAHRLADEREGLDEIAQAVRKLRRPIDLADTRGSWAQLVRHCNPLRFPERGQQIVCVPLATGDTLLGIMVLADRVRGVRYTSEELDLLQTIGEQVGAKLLNLHLSARLLEAKQMEAFQAMSAFFVHDLKNTSSTLSLMLQNLPKHFENPTFRQDALAAISKSVNKINELIRRLTSLRQSIDIAPVESDVNDLVRQTVAHWATSRQLHVDQNLGDLPPVFLDPDQINKVLTNLLLNAGDAVDEDGCIRISTRRQEEWVVVEVADTGCGMSREFIEASLFRPFRSTKQAGMGIGLFHSKMIVEAHQGRLEVDSREGEGSTFRVVLPLCSDVA